MIKTVLSNGVSLALGVLIGVVLLRTPERPIDAGPGTAISSSVAATSVHRTQEVQPAAADEMRAMLKEELATALASALAAAGDNHPSAALAPRAAAPVNLLPPQQRLEALQAANDIIAGGQWGEDERINFHQQLAQLDPVQAEQAMQSLVRAIDNGSIKVTTEGPLL